MVSGFGAPNIGGAGPGGGGGGGGGGGTLPEGNFGAEVLGNGGADGIDEVLGKDGAGGIELLGNGGAGGGGGIKDLTLFLLLFEVEDCGGFGIEGGKEPGSGGAAEGGNSGGT